MAFTPDSKDPNFQSLLGSLNTSGLQRDNNAAYQVIATLLKYLQIFKNNITNSINDVSNTVSTNSQSINVNTNPTYLTAADEVATLPNSRELLAGTNVTFDDSVSGQRTVNVASGGTITGSGTTGKISQWASSSSLTDVDAAGISSALDLLGT